MTTEPNRPTDDEQPTTETAPTSEPTIARYDTEGAGYGAVYGPEEPHPFKCDDEHSVCNSPSSVLAELAE